MIFGKVTSGIDAVDTIAESPVQPSFSGENSTPVVPDKDYFSQDSGKMIKLIHGT